jgi:hypothetical protein
MLYRWIRDLHLYFGLFISPFVLLFAASVVNHHQWFRNLYDRQESRYEMPIEHPAGDTVAAQTRNLMRQLDLQGEIDWPASQPVGHLDFSVNRPTDAVQVRADLNAKKAYVRRFDNNKKLAFQIFHTFSGSRFNHPASARDWVVTTVWLAAMDALAVGLVAMVFGSYYMWWQSKKRHALGISALLTGVISCFVFVTAFL